MKSASTIAAVVLAAAAAAAPGCSCSDDTTTSSASTTSSSSTGGLPDTFTVTGIVDDGKSPVAGAYVMQAGGKMPMAVTGADGKYSVELSSMIPGARTVVAGKIGYRSAGIEFGDAPVEPVNITILEVNPPDNEAYVYTEPGTGDAQHDTSTAYCGYCHKTLAKQFNGSKHANAAKDPFLQDLYAGVTQAFTDQASCTAAGGDWRDGITPGTPGTAKKKCYLGGGVLSDINTTCGAPGDQACDDPALSPAKQPKAFGSCADCHAPGIDGKAGGRNLHEAAGVSYENGNHCDFCHHVRDVDLTKPPGVGGALVVQRPSEKDKGGMIEQAMFGPYPDVPFTFMGGSYQPLYAKADFCGGCHEQKQESLVPGQTIDKNRWPDGLPTHSTYSEGSLQSSRNCQSCHMPADMSGLESSLDGTNESNASIILGFIRKPVDIAQHVFLGPLGMNGNAGRLFDTAVGVGLDAQKTATEVDLSASVTNVQAGHGIPTGEPMRSLVLVITAEACGKDVPAIDGQTVDDRGDARASGVAGTDATFAGTTLTWTGAGAIAKAGDVVRVVHPTGNYDDYQGIGFFANPNLTPQEKGLEIKTPVGEAKITAVNGDALTLDATLTTTAGDLVFLGDALPATGLADGDPSRSLEGHLGWTFARVLVDGTGKRNVPHYRAVDIVSDNRVGPEGTGTSKYKFAVPACSMMRIHAQLVYRPIPIELERDRGWKAQDYVVVDTDTMVTLP